ncbi:unnamed protein product [Prorocentrum cordatum]|uniref:DNA (cytosine-5-)-methyltransferase n=1 Tax=Prorocentrum cordatum TaxID=2364126 RepID=A0ABN9PBS3_9DINO|nr:unnamed protein product [Polarella glacialis]
MGVADPNTQHILLDGIGLAATFPSQTFEDTAKGSQRGKGYVTSRAVDADSNRMALQALEAVRIQLNGQASSLDQQHDERMDKHDEKLQALQGELAEFKKLLAVAEERPVVPVAVPSGFSRDPDHALVALVVVMSQVPTTLAAVKKSLDEWLLSLAFKPEDYNIEADGPLLSRRFPIKFGGLSAPATRKVQAVLPKLRENGVWREFWAEVDGAPARRLHLGPGESPQQVKQEITLRKCKDAFQELRGAGSRIFLGRERGALPIGWGKVLRVEAAGAKASLKKNYLARLRPHRAIAPPQGVRQGNLQLRAFMNEIYPESALITSFVGAERSDVLLTVFNIHNQGMRSDDIRRVTVSIDAALRAAQDGPARRLVAVNGDFNFAADEALILRAPSAAIRRPRRRLRCRASDEPSHYVKDTNESSCIDRVFCSLASWQACQMHATSATVESAAAVSDKSGLAASSAGLPKLVAASSKLDRKKKGVHSSYLELSVEGPGHGLVRACAGDIGEAVRSIVGLLQVFRIMQLAEYFANLVLKIPKCMVVPLAGRFSVPLAARVKAAILEAIPTWADLEVVLKLLYLGLWFGPEVGPCDCWTDPVAKLRLRAQAICRGATPPSVSAILYSTRAVATLSYVAQIAWLPPKLLALELPTLAQAFPAPLGALSLESWAQLFLWGGPRVLRWGRAAVASLARAATLAFPEHEQILHSLVSFVNEHDDWRTLCMLRPGRLHPSFWRSQSHVGTLAQAAAGLGPPGQLSPMVPVACEAPREELQAAVLSSGERAALEATDFGPTPSAEPLEGLGGHAGDFYACASQLQLADFVDGAAGPTIGAAARASACSVAVKTMVSLMPASPSMKDVPDVSEFFLGKLPTEQRQQLDAAVALATSEGRFLRVGTACSGTDSPVAVFRGLAKAMPRLKVEHTFSCESDVKKRQWITDNFPDLPYLFGDIQELPTGAAFNYITGKAAQVPPVDILIAGFVCKSVSLENNERNKYANCIKEACGFTGITFQGMIQYVQQFQPAVVICENVEGLVKKNRGLEPVVNHVKDEFASSGYAFHHKVLDSRDFLLPHRRKRCWMWAFRGLAHAGAAALAGEAVLALRQERHWEMNALFRSVKASDVDMPRPLNERERSVVQKVLSKLSPRERGEEVHAVQGIFKEDFPALARWGKEKKILTRDLAGNAFSTTVCMAVAIAVLCHGPLPGTGALKRIQAVTEEHLEGAAAPATPPARASRAPVATTPRRVQPPRAVKRTRAGASSPAAGGPLAKRLRVKSSDVGRQYEF